MNRLSLKTALTVCRLCGSFPFVQPTSTIVFSKRALVWSTAVSALLSFLSFYYMLVYFGQFSGVFDYLHPCALMLPSAILNFNIINAYIFRKRFTGSVQFILNYCRAKHIDLFVETSLCLVFYIANQTIIFASGIVYFLQEGYNLQDLGTDVYYVVLTMVNFSICFQIYCLVMLIAKCFSRLNENLDHSLVCKNSIEPLLGDFINLRLATEKLWSHFAVLILFEFIYVVGTIIAAVLWCVMTCGEGFASSVYALTWVMRGLLEMFFILKFSSKTSKCMSDFTAGIYSYHLKTRENLPLSKSVLLHLCARKELKFTANGCFSLDYKLVTAVLSTCITYAIILLQLNQKGY